MFIVEEETIQAAHIRAIQILLSDNSHQSNDPELAFETAMLLRIVNPANCASNWLNDSADLESVLAHLSNAKDIARAMVEHYSDRINQNDLQEVIDLLNHKPYTKKAVLALWQVEDINRESGSACINYYWFRRLDNQLICRGHMRACDVYTKLRANIAISCGLHDTVANRIGLKPGVFELFVDCAHIYQKDLKNAQKIAGEL